MGRLQQENGKMWERNSDCSALIFFDLREREGAILSGFKDFVVMACINKVDFLYVFWCLFLDLASLKGADTWYGSFSKYDHLSTWILRWAYIFSWSIFGRQTSKHLRVCFGKFLFLWRMFHLNCDLFLCKIIMYLWFAWGQCYMI